MSNEVPETAGKTRIRWTGTEPLVLDIPVGKKPAKGRDTRPVNRITFGSTLDEGIVKMPQPELNVDSEVWAEAMKIAAVRHLVKERKLVIYG